MGKVVKLYIKEKAFSWNDQFTVTDESGAVRYIVEGELFSWGKKLHVCTPDGRQAAYIEEQFTFFRPRYQVFVRGALIGEVVRELSFFHPRFTVEGAGWDVEGDVWAHEYTVSHGGSPIVHISREWLTWGDSYALDFEDAAHELQALSLVLAIDCAMEKDD